MKRIFTLLSFLGLSISLFAADAKPKSMLVVKSLDAGNIQVLLDGRKFEPGFNSVAISGVDAGYHTIQVYRQKSGGFMNIFGSRFEMIYNTSLSVRPRTNLNITIDRLGRTTINETKVTRGGYGRSDDWSRGDDRDHQYDYDRDGKFGDYDTHYGYTQGMSDAEFNQVVRSINTEWLESNKLKSVTQIVTTNFVTTAQVKQLMCLFSIESNKVEVAKQAYRNTIDKDNFFMVNDELRSNNCKDDLARFIRSFR